MKHYTYYIYASYWGNISHLVKNKKQNKIIKT